MGNHMNTLEQIKRDSRYQTDQRTVTVKTHAAE